MDDYIFLIIAIAISIFGAISQTKKKKAQENSAPVEDKGFSKSFMDQFLGEDFLDETEEEVKPVVRIKPILQKEPATRVAPVSHPGYYHESFKSTLPDRPKQGMQSSMRKPQPEVTDTEFETDDTPGYMEDFSLRKAFVYSEIMNRRY